MRDGLAFMDRAKQALKKTVKFIVWMLMSLPMSVVSPTTDDQRRPKKRRPRIPVQPIAGRTVVYVCQGGVFEIIDTTTDQQLVQTTPTVIVGVSIDVKLVDPHPS